MTEQAPTERALTEQALTAQAPSLSTLFLLTLCLSTLLLSAVFAPPAAAQDLKIVDFSFSQHILVNEAVTFAVRVKNNESSSQDAFTVIILTNSAKGLELEVDSATQTIPGGETRVLTSNFTFTVTGIYTVSLRVHSSANVRLDRVTAKFPIHVGTNTDLLHVFPEALNVGTIPPGRFVLPVPLEIRWDFYRFNQLALDQPFAIRVYTDNAARYRGIEGAVRQASPAGLISDDGRFTIPVKLWTVNFGPDVQETGWDPDLVGAPPVDDDTFWRGPLLTDGTRDSGAAAWLRVPDLSEMSANPATWRRLIGQDSYDTRFVTDNNVTGDFTLPSPVTVYVATEVGPTAVHGQYSATLVVELWTP